MVRNMLEQMTLPTRAFGNGQVSVARVAGVAMLLAVAVLIPFVASTFHLLQATMVVVYAAAVLLLAIRVLGYGGSDWLLVLIVLTLPWSLVSAVFLWSLIHGASLWLFWLVFLGGGAANAFLSYRYLPRVYARLSRRERLTDG